MEGPAARELLATLHKKVPAGYKVLLRTLPGGDSWSVNPLDPDFPLHKELGGQYFFSVVPRGPGGVIDLATCVWLDRDECEEGPVLFPKPTAVVLTGGQGKFHAYWRLEEPVGVDRALRSCRLARLAYDGDPAVCESKRIMRLPGYYNLKYNPPTVCQIAEFNEDVEHRLTSLEEQLVAQIVSLYWDGGNRHQIALALGASLARADWDEERVEQCVKYICEITKDEQTSDRIQAAVGSVRRRGQGEPVSAAALRDAMSGEDYRAFLQALGVGTRDGDILLNGVKVANQANTERDLAQYIVEQGTWAVADGIPVQWSGSYWTQREESGPVTDAFWSILSKATVIQGGVEVDFTASARLASSIGRMVLGKLTEQALEVPPPNDLPVQNGVLDLAIPGKPVLKPHAPENRNRWVLPVTFDPRARAPRWIEFIHSAVGQDERRLLQEWFGYLLAAGNPYESMLWLWGPPETGKSTFIHAIDSLLQPTAAAIRLAAITQYSLASLAEKRVAFCTEMPSRELRTDTLKALVSSDQVEARHIYGRPFNLRFQGKIVWATNSLPDLDQAEGIWRRLVLVRFDHRPSVPDTTLKTAILEELPGILNWALGGLRRQRSRGWTHPASVLKQIGEYRESADEFRQFAEESLVLGDLKDKTPSSKLYMVYKNWCEERGFKPKSHGPQFHQELRNLGCEWLPSPIRINKQLCRAWAKVRLQEEVF